MEKNEKLKKKSTWWLDARPWILLGLLQIPSTRNYLVSSSIPYPLAAWGLVTVGILAAAYLFLHQPNIRTLANRIFASHLTTIALLTSVTLASLLLYPRIEGLGRGGTGDDALILPIQALLHGGKPYDVRLFDGAPISPGLGWLLLNGLFAATSTSWLMNGGYMGVAAFLASYKRPARAFAVNASLLFMLASFAVIEQIYSQQDLLAIGWAFLICALLVEDHLTHRSAGWIGLLTGLAATSRIIFIYLPLILTIVYWKSDPHVALRFGLAAGITALAWHVAGIVTSNFYQPLHLLFDRGPSRVGIWVILAGGLVTLVSLALALRDPQSSMRRRFTWLALIVGLPMLFISLGELLTVKGDFSQWEAARYWLPALPTALFALFFVPPAGSEPLPAVREVVRAAPVV